MPGIIECDRVVQSGTEKQGESRIGTEDDGAGQVAWISIISEWSAEKSGTDLGGAATGFTDQYGVVCDDGGGVHRWTEVYVS